jgi:hypothetical protein
VRAARRTRHCDAPDDGGGQEERDRVAGLAALVPLMFGSTLLDLAGLVIVLLLLLALVAICERDRYGG